MKGLIEDVMNDDGLVGLNPTLHTHSRSSMRSSTAAPHRRSPQGVYEAYKSTGQKFSRVRYPQPVEFKDQMKLKWML